MIDVKMAVSEANKRINELLGQKLPGLELEEVEKSEDNKYWLITLGYYVEEMNPNTNVFITVISGERKYLRKYKLFKIDAETGEVVSMLIRNL